MWLDAPQMKNIIIINFNIILLLLNFNNVFSLEPNPSTGASFIFYVATNGNDQWTGTLPDVNAAGSDGPFATVKKAIDAVRGEKKNGSRSAFTILVRGGVYELGEPLVIGPEDSGTESGPFAVKAHPNEHPVLSGFKTINNFEPYMGKIYKADIARLISFDPNVRQLFAHGKRQILARYPNYDPLDPIGSGFLYVKTYAEKGSKRKFINQTGDVHAWPALHDAEVFIYPGNNWGGEKL